MLLLARIASNPSEALFGDLQMEDLTPIVADYIAALCEVYPEDVVRSLIIIPAVNRAAAFNGVPAAGLFEETMADIGQLVPSHQSLVVAYLTGPGAPDEDDDVEAFANYLESRDYVLERGGELALWTLVHLSQLPMDAIAERAHLSAEFILEWLSGSADLTLEQGQWIGRSINRHLVFAGATFSVVA